MIGHEKKPTRTKRYLTLLRASRKRGRPEGVSDWPEGNGWVSLPEVQREAGAQHGARKQELEALGHVIENTMLRRPDGEILSWYRLVHDAADGHGHERVEQKLAVVKVVRPESLAVATGDRLFADDQRHLDLG